MPSHYSFEVLMDQLALHIGYRSVLGHKLCNN